MCNGLVKNNCILQQQKRRRREWISMMAIMMMITIPNGIMMTMITKTLMPIIAVIRMMIMAFVNLQVSNVTLTSFTFSPCNIPGTSLLCGEELFPAPRIASRRNKIGSLGESSSGVKLNFTLASILSSSPLLSRKGCRGM